ncbi:hypothetical protein [Haladaptatus sp. DFWS20]|uniref:hypothetical protein n=1 Tax=Haladaptatus sp. DFWS20 TaxID=3403467 RepID=UPI003EC10AE9
MTTAVAGAEPVSITVTPQTATTPECKSPTAETTACSAQNWPWGDDTRAAAKTAIFEYLTRSECWDAVPVLVNEVFGVQPDGGTAEYQLARRFVTDECPELFETDRFDGCRWVSPTPAALHLTRSKQRMGHPRALNGAELGRRFGVNRSTTHNDFDVLAEYITETSTKRRDMINEIVYHRAIRELQADGDHYKAAKVLSMWNDWLMDRGKTSCAADKTELAVTGTDETDAIRVLSTSDTDIDSDGDQSHGEITDTGGW